MPRVRTVVLFVALVVPLAACAGMTPLHASERATDLDLLIAATNGDAATIQRLLSEGANPNAESSRGWTVLMRAAENGHAATVQALLAKGADPNAKNNDGYTALMLAAAKGDPATVEALLAKGADPNAKRDGGQTALMLAEAAGHRDVVQVLKRAEAGLLSAQPTQQAEVEKIKAEAEKARAEVEKIKAEAEKARAEAERAKAKTERARAEAEQAKAEAEKAKAEAAGEPGGTAKPPLAEASVDIEELPKAALTTHPDAYAVVIGIEKYTDLAPPEFAVRDATWVKEYLVRVLGYPEENIQLLTNEQATYSRIKSALETWLPNQDPKGSVFVYYSGHGAPDPTTGESYLVPLDGSPSDLKTTGYPLKRLAQALAHLPAKELIVAIDACFSGQPGTRSVIAQGTKPMVITAEGPWAALGDRGIVFTAGNQVSTVYQEKRHGLFTYFFLKGLQGAADQNGDGRIGVQELFTYLRPEVVKTARRQNVAQEPGLWPPAAQLGPRALQALAVMGR